MASAMKHLLEQTMFGNVLPEEPELDDGQIQLTLSFKDVESIIHSLDDEELKEEILNQVYA
tara:strand:- start:102 stop:284 length:183 start_codon:yes stop_codon:yes gene_type:complete